ncbi:MAG: hypothetical protein Q8K60_00485 [Parachlamydiaceae bacterium]|nr:hypothetical protein [Parachlamydiaceae bacterium]
MKKQSKIIFTKKAHYSEDFMKTLKIKTLNVFFVLSLFIFSVNCPSLYSEWSPPVQISPGPSSVNPIGTPLVINNNSVALVGWLDGAIGTAQTLSSANLIPFSTQWTNHQLIYANFTPGMFPSFPIMSQNIFGGSLAAFGLIDPMTGAVRLYASRRPKGINFWLPPITEQLTGSPNSASITSGELGDLAVAFALTSTGTSPYMITLSQLPAASNEWITTILAIDNSAQPAVAINLHLGNGDIAWKVNTPTLQIQTVRFNFITQEAASIINVPLPPLATDIVAMFMDVDNMGDVILIYGAQIGANVILYSSTLLAGQEVWSNPLLISDPANTVVGASIATDALGKSTILWEEQITPTQQFVRVATLPLGGFPIKVTDLTDRTLLNTTIGGTSRVAMDSYGNAVAIWGITTGGIPMIQVSSKAIKQNWTTPITLSTNGTSPLITLSDQGTAVATWIDGTTSILWGSRNLYLFTLRPPSQFSGRVTENISSEGSSFVLRLSWNPSPAPNIVNYEIYLNGTLIGTVPGIGPFTFNVPLTTSNIVGVYTLIAVASNGNRSIPITLNSQPVLAPPTHFEGRIIKNKFATQTSFFLAITWDASPAQNVIEYEIFKNGRLVSTISANQPLEYVKHLHSSRAKGDYLLVAVSANGIRSVAIPLHIIRN